MISCGKIGYGSKKDADKGIKQIQFDNKKFSKRKKLGAGGRKNNQKMSCYHCEDCDQWHITTMSQAKYKRMSGR